MSEVAVESAMIIQRIRIALFVMLLAVCAGAQQPVANIESHPKNPREPWTQLSIAGLDLPTLAPLPGGVSEFPDFTRELVRVEWRSGDPVDLYIVRPKGVQKPPVVLYLYGHNNDSQKFQNEAWCRSATEGGFAAVGFVSALAGERFQHRALNLWFVSELQEALGATTHDVQKIIDYLQTRGDLDTERIGMFAQGSGASIAILAASVDRRITSLDLLDPWGDWPEWLKESAIIPENEKAAYAKPEFLAGVANLDPLEVFPHLPTKKVRLMQVANNPAVPKVVREKLAAAAPTGTEIVKYDSFASFQQAWLRAKLWDWSKAQLQPASAPPAQQKATNEASQAGKDLR